MKLRFKRANLFLTIYYILFAIRYYTNLSYNITTAIWTAYGVFLFVYYYIARKNMRNIIALLFIIDCIGGLGMAINQNYPIYMALTQLTLQGVGLLLYDMKDDLSWVNKISHINIIFLFFVSTVLRIQHMNEVGFIYTKLLSMNGISLVSTFMICVDILYHHYNKRTKINIIWYIMGLWISLMCGGNGGILSMIIVFLGLFAKKKNKSQISIWKTICIAFIGIALLYFTNAIVTVEAFLTDDNSRFSIWGLYAEAAFSSRTSILYGASVSSSYILAQIRNMHNTFINFHYFYGLIPFLFFNGIILVELIALIIQKKYLLLIICVVTVVRGFTDAAEFVFLPLWTLLFLDIVKSGREKVKEPTIMDEYGLHIMHVY